MAGYILRWFSLGLHKCFQYKLLLNYINTAYLTYQIGILAVHLHVYLQMTWSILFCNISTCYWLLTSNKLVYNVFLKLFSVGHRSMFWRRYEGLVSSCGFAVCQWGDISVHCWSQYVTTLARKEHVAPNSTSTWHPTSNWHSGNYSDSFTSPPSKKLYLVLLHNPWKVYALVVLGS